ncbi:MAG: HlyD family efflux transporter periplasmic adaptor subunit [Planctomycetes bacterium]|nr:HlyD family efflux transporter periplasmic adaptor subunit [Planctomycetota bacterium]
MQQVIDSTTERKPEKPVIRAPFGIAPELPTKPAANGPTAFISSTTSRSGTGNPMGTGTPETIGGGPRLEPTQAPSPFSWTEIPPDGSIRNAELFLLRLEKFLQARVFLSVGSSLDRLKIVATTASGFEEKTKQGSMIRNALREACSPAGICRFAVPNGQTSLLLQQVLEDQDASLVLGFQVGSNRSGANSGANGPQCASLVLMVDRGSEATSASDYAQKVDAIRKIVTPWLEIWWLCHCGMRWQKTTGSMGRFLLSRKRSILLSMAAFLAILCIPVPYWPKRECVLEPAKKNFIASPIDGILKDIAVRPGDDVTTGTLLARLDDESLRWELSTAQADMESAGKRRDAALTSRNSGDLRLAQLEQERQRVTIASLEKKLQDLELRSPVDGVIVQGNIDEHNGMPVTRGNTLFEIAPLDRMRLEVHLSTADLANIEVGQKVTLRVDADRWSYWTATITRIAPRAKVVDSEVVFVATAEIENSNKILRPGMDGKVRISAGMKSIGWLVFSKPYEWLISKLYW